MNPENPRGIPWTSKESRGPFWNPEDPLGALEDSRGILMNAVGCWGSLGSLRNPEESK